MAICPDSHEILFVKLTDNKTPDHKIYPQFIKSAPKTVMRTYGDGAYDRLILTLTVCSQVPNNKFVRIKDSGTTIGHQTSTSSLDDH